MNWLTSIRLFNETKTRKDFFDPTEFQILAWNFTRFNIVSLATNFNAISSRWFPWEQKLQIFKLCIVHFMTLRRNADWWNFKKIVIGRWMTRKQTETNRKLHAWLTKYIKFWFVYDQFESVIGFMSRAAAKIDYRC